MTGLSAVAQAMNIAKGLREIEKGFDAAEFKLKIADLYTALADAKLALADAKTEIESKQAEVEALIAQFQVRTATIEYRGYKYERSATDNVLYSITKHAMRRSADEIGATSISFRPKVFSDPA